MAAKLRVYQGGKSAPKPKRRRRKPVPKNPDAHMPAGVVFETVSIYVEGEGNIAHRHRITMLRKGGIAENLYDYGAREYITGNVSEFMGGKKWSKPRFGIVPTEYVTSITHYEDEGVKHVGIVGRGDGHASD